ncbi:hypothetical protein [Andreprevotia chitinilytica]|uniref:hypothetical protein n=1 Tax=Andreprevotia chitinilytica TaxID=396808 RepID=UPI00054F3A13|nr:hypothetical protein [Andreprevotia chitinilytica]
MSDVSTATLKKWGMDIGDAIWGTVQGAFNERQTTTQVIVDAAIGMIPLVGDVTAARDLLAVSIRLVREPARRTQVMEWVLLTILIFALIPVAGGVIKGVGRLAMRVGKDVAENHKILAEIIGFLNRMGHGNAVKWLKELEVLKYEKELVAKFKGFCESISTAIGEILKARIGKMLPDRLRNVLISIRDGMLMLRDLGAKYIPEGLKEFHTKLKVLQGMLYKGEIHMLATGEKQLTREVEAHLIEKEVRAAIKAGKYPQNLVSAVNNPEKAAQLASLFDQKKIAQGWPDLLRKAELHPGYGNTTYYKPLSTFSGKIDAWAAEDFAGKTIFRSFGTGSKLAPHPTNAQGYFWGVGHMPASGEAWRGPYAVLDEWNGNGLIVLVTFPSASIIKKEHELEVALKGWFGQVSEQFGDHIRSQYLEGGGHQVGIGGFPAKLEAAIKELGEAAKAGKGGGTAEVMGVKIEVKATGWVDVEGKHGYAASGEDVSKYAQETRRLEVDEVKSKLSNHPITAGARVANQAGQPSQQGK